MFHKLDSKFGKMYDYVVKKMWRAVHNSDSSAFEQFLHEMDEKRCEWDTSVTDHFGRTIMHAAVEENNETLVRTLLHVGFDVNSLEGCGASPLTLAVLNKKEKLVKLLHEHFALSCGPLFAKMPSPLAIAKAMELDDIVNYLKVNLTVWKTACCGKDLREVMLVKIWFMMMKWKLMKLKVMVLLTIGLCAKHAQQSLLVTTEQIKFAGVSGIVPCQHMVGVQSFQVTCTLRDIYVKLVLRC